MSGFRKSGHICVCMFCVYLCNGVGTIITLHEGTDSSMAINYCWTVVLKKCGSHITDCGYLMHDRVL